MDQVPRVQLLVQDSSRPYSLANIILIISKQDYVRVNELLK